MKHLKITAFKETKPLNQAGETKFGGQPDWLEQPEWPLSRTLKRPMRFICQISLPGDLFPGAQGKMAYIFMTDDEQYVDGTWEYDGGENAVIIQPGGITSCETTDETTGPSLRKFVKKLFRSRLQPVEVQYEVSLSPGNDPVFIPEETLATLEANEEEEYREALVGNKISGTPGFMQGDEFPKGKDWKLLLQLDSCEVPFNINFGDAGIGYIFINENHDRGQMMWQCL